MCRADVFHSSCCLNFRLLAQCKLHLETKTSLILQQDENLVLRTSWTQGSWLEPLVLYHWTTITGQAAVLTIFCMYVLHRWYCIPGSHLCVVRALLGVDQKILSIRREFMLSGLWKFLKKDLFNVKGEILKWATSKFLYSWGWLSFMLYNDQVLLCWFEFFCTVNLTYIVKHDLCDYLLTRTCSHGPSETVLVSSHHCI